MPAGHLITSCPLANSYLAEVSSVPNPLVPDTNFQVKDGHVRPPRGPGLGVTIDERALEAHTLLKEVVQ